MTEHPTCKTCPWWAQFPDEAQHHTPDGYVSIVKFGECGRFPHHERTHDLHWCGEHPDWTTGGGS
jgi:hypothetical protein